MHVCNSDNWMRYYKYPKSLRDHKQTIHEKRRYTCDVEGCNKMMAQRKNLKRHKEKHHGMFTSKATHEQPLDPTQSDQYIDKPMS